MENESNRQRDTFSSGKPDLKIDESKKVAKSMSYKPSNKNRDRLLKMAAFLRIPYAHVFDLIFNDYFDRKEGTAQMPIEETDEEFINSIHAKFNERRKSKKKLRKSEFRNT
ncbi:MAG: hypothetical protein IM574_10805 [Cytophagales bacterium]|jgi:hypothetical protein|nr:hypothetical protein [Cytophagales bacterium]MCA6387523.1 hypothetical protein [Cytophagales bacterium]MCA6391194.1 hypothetical protein [Cytophagales bacterium]MCA6395832.1 hypothetical protein [Cytophagales bacterium]MCA6397661.1 hypothetical protein [Cytophagales bacterium]